MTIPCCPYCEYNLTAHEIGVLFGRVCRLENSRRKLGRYGGAKLSAKDVKAIRRSGKPIREIAQKYNVSFHTIWRVKRDRTYTGATELVCPHCGHTLAPKNVHRLIGVLGGSQTSPRKHQASSAGIKYTRQFATKLTWKGVNDIRMSKLSITELAKKYGVTYNTIWEVRKNMTWKARTKL